jgi:hypothetical protein
MSGEEGEVERVLGGAWAGPSREGGAYMFVVHLATERRLEYIYIYIYIIMDVPDLF